MLLNEIEKWIRKLEVLCKLKKTNHQRQLTLFLITLHKQNLLLVKVGQILQMFKLNTTY